MICALVAAAGLVIGLWGPAAGQGAVRLMHGKIVLGVINDQSGVYADIGGKNGVEAVRMAAEDFVKKYGPGAVGGPIEVISADHQNKPDLGAAKASEFYDRDNVDAIIDVPTSSVGIAIANVAAQKKRVFLVVGAATTAITNEACNKYTSTGRTTPTCSRTGPAPKSRSGSGRNGTSSIPTTRTART